MGHHQQQQQQNVQSTKLVETIKEENEQMKTESVSNHLYIKICQPTNKIYSDQTGRFPVISSKGHQYIFVLYNYNGNSI